MSTIENNKVVSILYTLKDTNGEIIDQSTDEPLEYLHGFQQIISGLEDALNGKTAGDKIEVVIEPEKAYGEYDQQKILQVQREEFDDFDSIEIDMLLEIDTGQGSQVVRISDLNDEFVTLDGNHPLAGQTLHFAVEISAIRSATEQELEHGHVHSGGHDH